MILDFIYQLNTKKADYHLKLLYNNKKCNYIARAGTLSAVIYYVYFLSFFLSAYEKEPSKSMMTILVFPPLYSFF